MDLPTEQIQKDHPNQHKNGCILDMKFTAVNVGLEKNVTQVLGILVIVLLIITTLHTILFQYRHDQNFEAHNTP